MKRILPLIFFSSFVLLQISGVQGQTCSECRYISPVFDSITIETVHFGRGVNSDGDTQELYMDIYQPFGDTFSKRPVVIFAFGGGFVTGSRDTWHAVEVCKNFTH